MKEGEKVIVNDKEYLCVGDNKLAEITHYQDGVPVLKTQVTTIDEGIDDKGNIIRSVKVNVPCVTLGMLTGNN